MTLQGWRRLWVGMALLASSCARLSPGPVGSAVATARRPGRVYVIRGFQDWYSTGMDRLTTELRAAGVAAESYREEQWDDLADDLLAHPAPPGPVVLIGFSYGADDVVEIARRLGERGRPVDLLVTIDPVTPDAVSANVRRCVCYYEPDPPWDLLPFLRGVPLHGDAGAVEPVDVDIRQRSDLDEPDTSHATIAGNEKLHQAIVDLVLSTCR